ncbi:cupin-like domain-containing protein [Aestuariivirga sp.]|uniref:cupin-like domain-containing protein n=1 Tax=Aestuariivirga sp. TaxID=2650926 RepID=UPI0039E2833D
MSIVTIDPAIARAKFLKEAFTLKHGLAGHPLFALPRLVELAKSLPRDRIEYNSGKVAVGAEQKDIPQIDQPAEEVIRSIETANAWMVIKFVNEDKEYRALLELFVEAANLAAGKKRVDYTDLQGFIFVSSANATTPFHIDAEENILIQIHGDKFVRTFDNRDRTLVGEEAMEISPSKHRNQHYEGRYEERATVHALKPGDALHMPYMIPHWVSTGESYSISMAMTWKTPEVVRLNKIRLMNGSLRRYGLPQKPPGVSPTADAAKVFAHDAMRMVLDPLRKSETMRRTLRGLIYGRNANYYYGAKAKKAEA